MIDLGKNHKWTLELVGTNLMRNKILDHFNISPHKLLTNYKREKKKVPSQLKNIMDTTNNETN